VSLLPVPHFPRSRAPRLHTCSCWPHFLLRYRRAASPAACARRPCDRRCPGGGIAGASACPIERRVPPRARFSSDAEGRFTLHARTGANRVRATRIGLQTSPPESRSKPGPRTTRSRCSMAPAVLIRYSPDNWPQKSTLQELSIHVFDRRDVAVGSGIQCVIYWG
jgi:hypothetical protein